MQGKQIDFTVDTKNLYQEESYTDLKVASIRRMAPVNPDGTPDNSRKEMFIGHTQLMSPEGPLPIQAALPAENLTEALAAFPEAMEKALSEMIEQFERMRREEAFKKQEESRIIIPGR